MPNKEALKEKIKQAVSKLKHRKRTEGQVNIEGISKPKKRKPKKVKENESKPHSPASVSIGAHGGRYIQEASGHKRYVKEGKLAGKKKFKKAVAEVLESIIQKSAPEEFIKNFKRSK